MLNSIFQRAVANGVPARLLSGDEIKNACPDLSCVAALESPSTGIVDTQSLMQSLIIDFEAAGGLLHCRDRVLGIDTSDDLVQVALEDGTRVTADIVINSAGLSALSLVPSGVEHSYKNFAPHRQLFLLCQRGAFQDIGLSTSLTRRLRNPPYPGSSGKSSIWSRRFSR